MAYAWTPTSTSSPSPESPHARDVALVGRIEAVKTVLRLMLETTGLRLGVVARVSDEAWTCCAVLDEMGFGLNPGDTLVVTTTFCNTVRGMGTPILIRHASQDSRFATHPAPKLYNVESYIAVPLFRRDGSFFGVMCALDSRPVDVPESKLEIFRHLGDLVGHQLEQEDELVRRDAQLLGAKEAAQLREQLIGIVSHDLRNPVNAISLSAATLLRRKDLDDRLRQGLGVILESARRADRLIHDLLDFTQVRMGQSLPVKRMAMNLQAITRQVVDEVGTAVPGRRFDVECAGDAQGSWDPDRIAQVLTNLLTNAVQYSPPGTPIRARIEEEGPTVVLSVSNDGTPIPAHVVPGLFEPMRRGTDEGERQNIGLGLFIVDQIVRAHGGQVDVESTPEAGTTFRVRLPRAER
ncbi:GAF domain-containing sensor histidine kinase [Pyxidicoccus fallax]|uniref:histidine kinase n=1 Tax=Pyxidicoccus fallax TaxID=394095 RepID=A0A848L7Y5_9BACT|nr:GAF domain-containing sensor histidine kinase [Pyxidicoccus fallax]NMO15100.1 GAF domain-containing sensor histidine kinase [Pyxidicoccus fallax]NPC79786.1 GAF domain-containing sensor histidine kinase [Pyxidicoccus fallax]